MTAERLLENFDRIADAPDAVAYLQEPSKFESPPLFKGGILRQAQQQKNELALLSAVRLLYSIYPVLYELSHGLSLRRCYPSKLFKSLGLNTHTQSFLHLVTQWLPICAIVSA